MGTKLATPLYRKIGTTTKTNMKLLYIEEHLSCYMYDNQKEPLIQYIEKVKGEKVSFNNTHNQLYFLIKGKIKYNFEYQVNKIFKAGTFLLFPRGSTCVMNIEECSQLVSVRLHHEINFCNHFPLTMLAEVNLSEEKAKENCLLHALKTNEVIDEWLHNVVKTVTAGLRCIYFQELKQKEILYYLRVSYLKEELYAFFAPILNSDAAFSSLIYQHYESTKSLEKLAKITNYSMSGFKRKFAKVFGIPPAQWMKREKAKKIYHEINCTSKPFKDLAEEYEFSSPAHFDKFCKRMYSASPGTLREKTRQRTLLQNMV